MNGEGVVGSDILGDLWGLARERLRGEVQAKNAEELFAADPRYGVDEYGQAFLRGAASTRGTVGDSLAGINPLVVVVAVLASAGLLYFALRD